MKTIRQIADELGVNKQAVHQKRKSKELSTVLQPFKSTIDGVIYIDVDGENIIKSAFSSSILQVVLFKILQLFDNGSLVTTESVELRHD